MQQLERKAARVQGMRDSSHLGENSTQTLLLAGSGGLSAPSPGRTAGCSWAGQPPRPQSGTLPEPSGRPQTAHDPGLRTQQNTGHVQPGLTFDSSDSSEPSRLSERSIACPTEALSKCLSPPDARALKVPRGTACKLGCASRLYSAHRSARAVRSPGCPAGPPGQRSPSAPAS